MRAATFAAVILALTAQSAWAQPSTVATARGGVLDLSGADFGGSTTYEISGEWQFWWDALVGPAALSGGDAPPPTGLAAMPRYWNDYELDGRKLPARGAATYRLSIRLPDDGIYGLFLDQASTSYRLYVNGEELASNGLVSEDPGLVVPEYRPQVVFFTPREGVADLVLQVANAEYRNGGQWQPAVLGRAAAIKARWDRKSTTELFLLGAIVMIGLYNLSLFVFRTGSRPPLWFGLFCLVVAARLAVTGNNALSGLLPGFPWAVMVWLELAIFHLGTVFFLLFFRSLYPADLPRWGFLPLLAVYSLLAIMSLAAPLSFFNRLVPVMQAGAVAGLLFVLACLALAFFRKRPDAGFILAGFVIFALSAVNDILFARGALATAYLIPLGLFAFILVQAVALARIFSRSFSQVERLSESLATVNRSLERFVPKEFLSFLDRRSISEVRLGDQTLRNMTVLFSDIRSFTTISESLSPQESFNFLNSYLERVGPIIRYHGGFIDKYIGDAIMALFPDSPSRAVEAAIAMQFAVRAFNEERVGLGQRPIQVGVGLHGGPAMLGIVGELERLESTVISDTVNLASRIEGLTKTYKTDVLISGTLVRSLGQGAGEDGRDLPCPFNVRLVDRVTVKGKSEPSDLYELLDSRTQEELAPFMASRDTFERAVALFRERRYGEAKAGFVEVARRNPLDQVARIYINRCSTAAGHSGEDPAPPDGPRAP